MLNFGLVPSDSGPRTMELLILNSGNRPVTLTSLVATPVTDALAVEFASVKVILVIIDISITVSVQDLKWPVFSEPLNIHQIFWQKLLALELSNRDLRDS